MSSRRYIRRIWRVPKNRGALDAFGTIVAKALRKHGWPADVVYYRDDPRVYIEHKFDGREAAQDFWDQVEIAIRIAARTYRVEIDSYKGRIEFTRPYVVTPTGHFVPWEKWFANHRKTARKRVTP